MQGDESPFDPNPPKNAVFLQPCDDAFGVLLYPKKRRKARPARAGLAAAGPLRVRNGNTGVGLDPDGNGLEFGPDF